MVSSDVMNSSEMAAIARVVNAIARDIRVAIDKLAPDALSRRQRLSRALLTSSIEHSVALTHLLAQHDPYYGYPAVTLFRPQIEALARGVFFTLPTASSDEEVESFLETDKMPKRLPADGGKPRTQHLSELLDSTRGVLKHFLPAALVPFVDQAYSYDLDTYNGFVHGGSKVEVGYACIGRRLLFSPDFYQLMNIARHSLAQAHFAEGVLSALVYQLEMPTDVAPDRNRLIAEYEVLIRQADTHFGSTSL